MAKGSTSKMALKQERSRPSLSSDEKSDTFKCIRDRFENLKDVRDKIKAEGLEECGLIFGIDYTMSNDFQGDKTFNGESLHAISDRVNPYQEVICVLGETLHNNDDDGIIPAYGFGDDKVKDKEIFPLKGSDEFKGFKKVLDAYNEVTPTIELGGPTNFAPLIRKAIEIVKELKKYRILIIVADGQVDSEKETIEAIVEASSYPISIVMIGVGDGPWEVMKEFDDKLPKRRFDNFQFVDFHMVRDGAKNPGAAFALAALMEIPDQYKLIKKLRLLPNSK